MANRPLSRVARLQAIELMLYRAPQGLRVVEIARRCAVDRRTIYRDLAALEESGVPLRQQAGRFSLVREQYLATVQVNFQEAVALLLAVRLFTGTFRIYNAQFISILNKLAETMAAPLAAQMAGLAEVLDLPDGPTVAVLETVTTAWLHGRKVRLWGRSSRGDHLVLGEFSPYWLEPTTEGRLYLVGYDDFSERVASLDLYEVQTARLLPTNASVPDSVRFMDAVHHRPESHRRGATVVLEFGPEVSVQARHHTWPGLQQIEDLPEGQFRLTLRVTDWRRLTTRLLAWGAGVKVLSPPELRQAVAQEAARVAALYHSGDDSRHS